MCKQQLVKLLCKLRWVKTKSSGIFPGAENESSAKEYNLFFFISKSNWTEEHYKLAWKAFQGTKNLRQTATYNVIYYKWINTHFFANREVTFAFLQ